MKTEEHVGNECHCWRDYIRRCIESKTFHEAKMLKLQPELRLKHLQKLQQLVFLSGSVEAAPVTDTIITAYRKAFEQSPHCQDCKLKLQAELEHSRGK